MDQSLPTRDIVVIGGSAGALEPLRTILSRLPGDLPAAVFVTLHITENSTLTSLLGRAANMPVHWASDKASFARGHIYVAPADHHLLLLSFGMRLSRGPRENRCRPAIDVLFRSAAASYGPRVIGVLLSGYQADGVAGLVAIKELGGKVIVQDPSEAEVPDMPQQASQAVSIDQSGTAAEIAMLLSHYVAQPAEAMVGDRSKYEIELAVAQGERLGSARLRALADPAPLTCPDCDGVLSQVKGARPLRFRCQIGHAITAERLLADQQDPLRRAMRTALRLTEEHVELLTRMAADARGGGRDKTASIFDQRAAEYLDTATTLRNALDSDG